MAEAPRLDDPNLKRSTVNSIIRTFRQEKPVSVEDIYCAYHYIYSKL